MANLCFTFQFGHFCVFFLNKCVLLYFPFDVLDYVLNLLEALDHFLMMAFDLWGGSGANECRQLRKYLGALPQLF